MIVVESKEILCRFLGVSYAYLDAIYRVNSAAMGYEEFRRLCQDYLALSRNLGQIDERYGLGKWK